MSSDGLAAEHPRQDRSEQDRPEAVPTNAADRFESVMQAVVRRLPFGLSRLVAPTLLGFALINSMTFALDLSLLSVLHSGLHWPLDVAITVSYSTAFAVSYLLNRTLNFRSHAPVGRQLGVYVLVVLVNYAVIVLGASNGFVALGVDYRIARVLAGGCEAVFMYCAMRFVVFREPRTRS